MVQDTKSHSRTVFILLVGSFLLLMVALSGQVQAETIKRQQNSPPAASRNDEHFSEGSNFLLFAARTIDTRVTYQPPLAAVAEDGKALHLVQFVGPIQDAWLASLKATGAEPIHYIAHYGYLLWAGESARTQLDHLAASSDFLRFSAPYDADLKSDPALFRNHLESDGEDPLVVTIQMLSHEGDSATKRILDSLVVKRLSIWEPVLKYQNMRASIKPSALETIKKLPDVVWIEPYHEPELLDEVQAQIIAGNWNEKGDEPAGPDYLNWLLDKGFSQDPADYPIIDITDDGLGNGDATAAAGDQTFRVAGDPSLDSRIIYLTNCTDEADASGPAGHGHLNASIAAGYDVRAGAPYQDEEGYQRGLGVNPFGRLAGTRVFKSEKSKFDLSSCPGTSNGGSFLTLIRQSYQAGARIISNSWGGGNSYTLATQTYDAAVRDADASTPGNQQLLILFSAGNEGRPGTGDEVGTVVSPANGKNVIAVGASENVRPTWIDGCGFGADAANDLQDIARFSSRGSAPGGRIKPDLVAPGTHVVGTASPDAGYNGINICDPYLPTDQTLFAASSGTSHAVPAVAGFASMATFWLRENFEVSDPSPALLKAFLIASTTYLEGRDAGDHLPNNNQGYGLPTMQRVFNGTPRIIIDQADAPPFDESGQTWTLQAHPAQYGAPLRIVMAFTDQPGSASAADPRVNNLDLQVNRAGVTYMGNDMIAQWSRPNGQADPVNTVEAVFLPPDKAEPLQITITAANIAGDGVPGNDDETDQDFALICHNCQFTANPVFETHLPVTIAQ